MEELLRKIREGERAEKIDAAEALCRFSRLPRDAADSILPALPIRRRYWEYAPTPYVVAANKQDMEDAWDLDDIRIALRLDSNVKLLPCVARDKSAVKNVLLELLYTILAKMEVNN